MIILKSCPVCKSGSIIKYREIGTSPHMMCEVMPGVSVETAIITHYFVCENCHVIFQNPRLSDNELDKFYSEGYYRRLLNMTDEEIDKDELQRAKVDRKIITECIGKKIGSHLDIGASRGFLLKEVRAKLKVAVEPYIKYVKVPEVKVYSNLSQAPKQTFNLVTIIHTLEHVSDPLILLENVTKLMDKDGYLIVEVPTWKSPGGPLRLPHLFHFEPDVLRLLCRELGLSVLETKFTPHLMLICRKIT